MDMKEKVKQLPQSPGVYRFLNENNQVIYVGKSNNLRSRVSSYFTGVKEGKIKRLVHQIENLEYETCDTHLEARLLECQRIKEIRPMFNKQLKRERGLVFLRIGQTYKEPSLSISKEATNGIGPFRNRRLLETMIESFERLYPMGFENSQNQLEFSYHVLPIRPSKKLHAEHQKALEHLMTNEIIWQQFVDDLSVKMMVAAEGEKFQEAIFYRDFIQQLNLFKRRWFEDVKIFDELLFLRIPIQSGVKFFRVKNGLIQSQVSSTSEIDQEFLSFMENSGKGLKNPWQKFSELEQYDFRDIIYSEIRSLPKDQVVRFDSRVSSTVN